MRISSPVVLVPVVVAALLFAAVSRAAGTAFHWQGYGENVAGSSKCPTYKMTIDVVVDGRMVSARFQQEGRPQRHFEAVLDAGGQFKTQAEVGGGGTISVTGAIGGEQSRVLLDGYCRFGGKLVRQ